MDETKEIHLINLKNLSMESKDFPKQITNFILQQQEINNVKETSDQAIKQLRYLGNLMVSHATTNYKYNPFTYRRSVFEDMSMVAERKIKEKKHAAHSHRSKTNSSPQKVNQLNLS